ncbi:MAG TPA: energy transducer TonB [Terriglobales bacterium]
MPELETQPDPQALGPEPELHLLLHNQTLDEPIWRSLFRNIDDFFFPKKLPPLVLTSKPVPVRDIWGFYNYKRGGVAGSTIIHVLAVAIIIAVALIARRAIPDKKPTATVILLDPGDLPVLQPSKTQSGGGGGGGDRDKLQASQGRLPKQSLKQQFVPPMAVVRNPDPKLAMDPTIVVPPDIHLQQPKTLDLGDPMSHLPTVASNGTGYGGGIGSGNGGGVGSGSGNGYGPGSGGGTGGGVFRVGNGVSAPKAIYTPEPEFSEEARKAKYQGVCVVWLVVGPDGRPRDIQVHRTLGLGLDEKAVEAVKTWRFEPAMKDGKPVSAQISVEVTFRLY